MAGVCPNCGAPLRENALFCQSCGIRLSQYKPSSSDSRRKKQESSDSGKKKGISPLAVIFFLIWWAVLAYVGFQTIPSNLRKADLPVQKFTIVTDEEALPEPEIIESDEEHYRHISYDWLYGEED